MPSLIGKAVILAIDAHGEQKRLYTHEPYWYHPNRVASTLMHVGAPWGGPWDEEVIAAAWLHDVVEDTPVTIEEIKEGFGVKVAQLVAEVTNPSKLSDGGRDLRKAMDREHLSKASPEGMSIKLADIIDNTSSIAEHDPGFAHKKYLPEMRLLLPLLRGGHPTLWEKADSYVNGASA